MFFLCHARSHPRWVRAATWTRLCRTRRAPMRRAVRRPTRTVCPCARCATSRRYMIRASQPASSESGRRAGKREEGNAEGNMDLWVCRCRPERTHVSPPKARFMCHNSCTFMHLPPSDKNTQNDLTLSFQPALTHPQIQSTLKYDVRPLEYTGDGSLHRVVARPVRAAVCETWQKT